MKRILSFILTMIITAACLFPGAVLAVNDDLDNPDDGLISQNEAYDDLLSDPPADTPEIIGTSYILYPKDVMEKDGVWHLPLYMAMFL